jgi:serine/threonine protein kinase
MKEILPEYNDEELLKQVEKLTSINHKHVQRCYKHFTENGSLYLLMEHCEGKYELLKLQAATF